MKKQSDSLAKNKYSDATENWQTSNRTYISTNALRGTEEVKSVSVAIRDYIKNEFEKMKAADKI